MRAQVQEVAAARQALFICLPFRSKFGGWTERAALLGARLASNRGGRAELLTELDDLRADVARSHAEFRAAVVGIATHGRIADVEAAYTRLLELVDHADARD